MLFHGWEYTAVAFMALSVWYHPLFLAAILGHLSHMTLDQLGNRASHPMAYSILYRIRRRFDHRQLVPRYERRLKHPPYWARLENLFWRIFAALRIR